MKGKKMSIHSFRKNPYSFRRKSGLYRALISFLVNFLIWSIKFLDLVGKFLLFFFSNIIFKPGRKIIRLFFYKVVVKLYAFYLSFVRKLGWSGRHENIIAFLFNQKFVHLTVFILAFFLIYGNLSTDSREADASVSSSRTIMASLVTGEFEGDGGAQDQLSTETESGPAIVKNSYLDNADSLKPSPQAGAEKGSAISDHTATIQGGTALVKPELAATNKTKRERKETIMYIVKAGDTISTIANEFDLTVNTLLWENNLTAFSLIRPGDQLRILPVSGVMYEVEKGDSLAKIAKVFNVSEEVILKYNAHISEQLRAGQKIIIAGGRKGANYQAAPVQVRTQYTGLSILKDLVKIPMGKFSKGSAAAPKASNRMVWPTTGYRITQYYHYGHSAIDVADKVGTAIYSADAGSIEFMGWSNGYGNNIVINHGGGKKTRYAHLSKFYVRKGEKVGKGENIAAMGNTGRSTGPHLHFEVIINGAKYNPLNYVR